MFRSPAVPLLLLALATAPAAAEEAWYPSRYGAGDTLGAANLLGPEKVLEAAKLVTRGKTYALGVEVSRETPAYGSRRFQLFAVASGDGSGGGLGENRATFNDDWVSTWLGIGTQLDGLGHGGIDHRYYNGLHVSEFWHPEGLTRLGLHQVPPLVTRGVLLDVAGLAGAKRLEAGVVVGPKQLRAAAKRQDVELREGDVVILHTGWQALADEDPERFLAGEPGLGAAGARYLAELGVVAVGADTWGLEVIPGEDPKIIFPVHQILLARHGVYILENIRTEELLADRAWEFLFVLGQPRMKGAVQMMINPVAIR